MGDALSSLATRQCMGAFCMQDKSSSYELILMKVCRMLQHSARKKWLDFGGDVNSFTEARSTTRHQSVSSPKPDEFVPSRQSLTLP